MLELTNALLAYFLIFLAPGLAATTCFPLPNSSPVTTRLLTSYLLSFPLIFFPGLLLARTHTLDKPHVLFVISLELFIFIFIKFFFRKTAVRTQQGAGGRSSSLFRILEGSVGQGWPEPPEASQAPRKEAENEEQGETPPTRGALSLNLWLLTALTLTTLHHLREILLTPATRGGFFYFSEVKYLLESTGIPDHVYHFTLPIIPQVDKIGFDITTAFYVLLGPENPLLLNKVAYLLTVLIGTIAVFEFFALFSSAFFAMLGSVLLYANYYFGSVVAARSFFIPETISFIFLILCYYFFFAGYLRKLSPHKKISDWFFYVILSSVALSGSALYHLEVALYGPLLLGIFTVLHILKTRGLFFVKKCFAVCVFAAFQFFGAYGILGILPEFAGGDTGKDTYQAFNGSDPTWEYFFLGSEKLPLHHGPYFKSFSHLISEVLLTLGELFKDVRFSAPFGFIFLVLTFLLLRSATSKWLVPKSKENIGWCNGVLLGVSSIFVIVVIIALTYLTDQIYDVFIYQTEMARRVAPYLSLFILIILLITPFVFSTREPGDRKIPFQGGLQFLFFSLALFCYLKSFPFSPLPSLFTITKPGVEALKWLEEKSPKNSVVLSNLITNGAFYVLSDTVGALEGHQPVLRPKLLHETLERISRAQEFFKDPIENQSLLESWNVKYILFKSSWSPDLGGVPIFPKSATPPQSEEVLRKALCEEARFSDVIVYSRCDKERIP